MRVVDAAAVLALVGGSVWLQGCGGGDSPGPGPSPGPNALPDQGDWKLTPIKVENGHLYDASTKQPFRMRGIGFPNCGDDVQEWIASLERICALASNINVVRLYQLPTCLYESGDSYCSMEPFMRRADDLGVYVIVPGTGVAFGYLPIIPAEFDNDAQTAYEGKGPNPSAVLGFGQRIIQQFNYPNTLAVTIGNEFDQKHEMVPYMGVLKAYARDLKSYLSMCNTEDASPTKGQMRQIPLAYASSDDRGDAAVQPKADYMMCDSASVSVDMFGLNVERWCDDKQGPVEYQILNAWVAEKNYPGSFFFSEMGCQKNSGFYSGTRTWEQVPEFFNTFGAIDGFAAYAYSGSEFFDMFDGGKTPPINPAASTATESDDGVNFFAKMATIGSEPAPIDSDGTFASCATQILDSAIVDYKSIKSYDTGPTGYAPQCPKPYGDSSKAVAIDTSILA